MVNPEVDQSQYITLEDTKTGRVKVGEIGKGKEDDIELDFGPKKTEKPPEDFTVTVDRLSSQVDDQLKVTLDNQPVTLAIEDVQASLADVSQAKSEIATLNTQAEAVAADWGKELKQWRAENQTRKATEVAAAAEKEKTEAAARIERHKISLAESQAALPQLRQDAQVALSEERVDMTSEELFALSKRAEKFTDGLDSVVFFQKRIAGSNGETSEVSEDDTKMVAKIKEIRDRANQKHDQESAAKKQDQQKQPQSLADTERQSDQDTAEERSRQETQRGDVELSKSRLAHRVDELRSSASMVSGIAEHPASRGFYLRSAFKDGRLDEYSSAINNAIAKTQELVDRLGVATEGEIEELQARVKSAETWLSQWDNWALGMGHSLRDAGQNEFQSSDVIDIGDQLTLVARRNHDVLSGNR